MAHLITLLAIICVACSPGALSIWLYAARGVGCIKVEGRPLCEPLPNAIGMPDAHFFDATAGTVKINIEFGFDAIDSQRPPTYNQDFSFDIPTGVENFVFTKNFCVAEKDNLSTLLICYKQDKVNFEPSENPYITTKWKGQAPKPPSVHGGSQSRLGTYDPNLEASNIFMDQETGSPVRIQTPDDADIVELAFGFPNFYPVPEDPWV